MQAQYVTFEGRLTFTFEAGADIKEVLQQLSPVMEVFSNDTCGSCECKDIRPVVRYVGEYTYYEFRCRACGHALQLGQRKDGGLFPKRKDADGGWLVDNGWTKWEGEPKAQAQDQGAKYADGSPVLSSNPPPPEQTPWS